MSENNFPAPESFCLTVPLYKEYAVTEESFAELQKLVDYSGHLDTYCPDCKSHTVFNCRSNHPRPWVTMDDWASVEFLAITAVCSRDKTHFGIYYFRSNRATGIQKVGQYPSTADSNLFDAKKYSKVLKSEDFRGFTKSIGLAAHGIGAGSLVYLRRIFESLIKEAHVVALKDSGWDEAAYNNGRMQDRVKLLKDHLPSFLVDHHKIYSVLSNGVHELSEDDCLEFFPLLKMSIELILDQKILEAERLRKTQDVSKFLSKFDQTQSK